MTIGAYEHRATLVAASGSTATTTLNVSGALLRQVLVRANTQTTLFRVNLVDGNDLTRINYGYHQHELNDTGNSPESPLPFLLHGAYTVNVTNVSPANDTFAVVLSAQE